MQLSSKHTLLSGIRHAAKIWVRWLWRAPSWMFAIFVTIMAMCLTMLINLISGTAEVTSGWGETLVIASIVGYTFSKLMENFQRELDRKNHELTRLNHQLDAERQKSEQLLLTILPQAIAERLKQGEVIIADLIDHAALLFLDIVGFTPFAATLSPRELVMVLNNLFSRFDRVVRTYHAEKIKTIGDAYMVAVGVP